MDNSQHRHWSREAAAYVRLAVILILTVLTWHKSAGDDEAALRVIHSLASLPL